MKENQDSGRESPREGQDNNGDQEEVKENKLEKKTSQEKEKTLEESANDKQIQQNESKSDSITKTIGSNLVTNAIASLPVARTLSEDRNSRDSAILQACLERKKEAFNQLKAWEEKRSGFLILHKGIMEKVIMKIEKRMKISEDSMAQLVRFFKERREQESAYSKLYSTKVPHIGHLWKDTSEQNSEWYPTLNKALKETDDSNESQGKSVQTLVLFLEKNIIKDLLYHENEEFEKKIKLLRNSLSDQISRLEKSSAYANKKNTSYATLYTQMITPEGQANKTKRAQRKDLMNVEIKFRQAAFDEINEQKALGQQVLQFWEEARKLEAHRLEVVSQVFQLYITKHQETYGALVQTQATLTNFKGFDVLKEISENFSVNAILQTDDQDVVRKTLSVGSGTPLEQGDLSRYFTNFNFKDINISQHSLVQKKFKILRDVGSVTKSFKECWMVATVDDILLFYDEISEKEAALPAFNRKGSAVTDGGKKVNNCPKKKFRLDCIKTKQRDDPTLIDIIETTPGLLFSSTSKQLIKFINEDDYEEFKVFMIRYQALLGQFGGMEDVQK